MSLEHVEARKLMRRARQRVHKVDVVLDVGPGIRPQTLVEPKVHICVEAFRPYVSRAIAELGGSSRHVFLHGTWQELLPRFADKSVDTVMAVDVIEHFTREDGEEFLQEAERLARCQVVLFTPVGLHEQAYEDGQEDAWGMQGGHWQTHRSGWQPEEFGEGWHKIVCRDFHQIDAHGNAMDEPSGAFWAIKNIAPPPRRRWLNFSRRRNS